MTLEKSKQVVRAWYELNNHPAFAHNKELMYHSPEYLIDPVLETGNGTKSHISSENTVLRYWFEILVPYKINEDEKKSTKETRDVGLKHDWELDDSADTYEDAILLIHKKIIEKYGPYEQI